jgi:hypothetical protein
MSINPHAQNPSERPDVTRHTRFVWHDAHCVKPIDGSRSLSMKRHVASGKEHSSLDVQPCSTSNGKLQVHVFVTSKHPKGM